MSTNPPFSFDAAAPVAIQHNGRWFINGGKPGFNCRANNRNGFATEAEAVAASAKYAAR